MNTDLVFLSYKNSDENGKKTKDALLAEELFRTLEKRGVNTFYASETINRLGESHYKKVIDDALDHAIVLVAVGTSSSNLNSNWVQYEWDSFYNDILNGRKPGGEVLSYYDDMSITDLPRTLRRCQAYKRGETALNDICDFICRCLDNSPSSEIKKVNPQDCRILNLSELTEAGLSALDVANAFSKFDSLIYKDMPLEAAGTAEQWAAIAQKHPDFVSAVVDSEYNIYGNYSLMGLTPHEEKLMSQGLLPDDSLSAYTTDNLYRAGKHTGYLLNLSIYPALESVEFYDALWHHLIITLTKFAKDEGVYFSRIYYKAYLPEHETKVVSRGFRFCCKDSIYGKIYVHDMDPNSSLLVLDRDLAEAYSKERHVKVTPGTNQNQDINALSAYLDFWKQIEDIFYQPEFIRIKKYFMGNHGVPQNSMEYKMGLALAEWIRDNLQYSEALLPFIPQDQRKTHQTFKNMVYGSKIIQDSMSIYQFSTEEIDAPPISIDGYSINALVTFANIWLDIDRLFMLPDLINYKSFFYDNRDEFPPADELETGEAIAIRLLSILKISERQLKLLPDEYALSYYRYKEMITSAKLTMHTLEKYPFLVKVLV